MPLWAVFSAGILLLVGGVMLRRATER